MNDFDFYIIFCNDGVLRMRYYNSQVSIPMKFMQEHEQIKDDAHFWFNWWNKNVVVEEGVTLGKLMECLVPWEVFWSNYMGIEINEYIKEGRKLSLVQEKVPFDWAMFRKHIVISHSCQYSRDTNIKEWFSKDNVPEILPHWTVQESYKLSGYKEDIDDHFNLASYPFNLIYNIPVYINKRAIIEFHDYWYKQSDKKSIFNYDGFGVRKLHDLYYVNGGTEYTVREFLAYLFNEFELNPSIRDRVNEDHRAMLAEVSAEIEEAIKEEGVPEDKTFIPSKAGIESLKVQMMTELNYWEALTEEAKKFCTDPLKIGTIKEGIEPVQFVYGDRVNLDEDI